MQQFVDTLIVIPNQNLFRIANEKTTFADAFAMADDVLHSGVRGVTDLMVVPGLINLDFADIRSVMSEMGKAMMGTGEADGEERAKLAAEAAISNPLLDDVSMKGARGVLINITGGPDMTLFEVDEAANRIGDEVDPNANIIFGSATDSSLEGRIRVSVVATGIDIEAASHQPPVLKVYSDPIAPKIDPNTASAGTTNVIMDIPPPAAPTTIMSGGGAAAALKISETQPSIEPRDLEQGNLEINNTPVQTDIITFVDTEVQKDNSSETAGDGVFAKNEEENLEDQKSVLLGENFIPPVPSEPAKASPARTVAAADPFREAEMLNPATVPEQKPTPNIFQRMTGGSWSKKNAAVEQKDKSRNFVPPVETSKPIETKNDLKNEPLEERPTSQGEMPDEDLVLSATSVSKDNQEVQPAAENMTENTKTEAPITPSAAKPTLETQPRLRGVEAKKRSPDSQHEEDLLEIPAFLRRQAN
jgi:cell division protein FtsZ